MLGQRNIITCVADFNFQSASEIPGSPSCGWYVNGTSHDNMSPNCLDPTENDEKVSKRN